MTENVKDIGAWVESANCFEVMGQLRKLGVLTRADMEKAMRLSRSEWISFMKEKIGLTPEGNNENRRLIYEEKNEMSEYERTLNPIITIQEDKGEQLFVIADFSIPGNPDVRRIISKRRADGKISAVTYIGTVGADRIVTKNAT